MRNLKLAGRIVLTLGFLGGCSGAPGDSSDPMLGAIGDGEDPGSGAVSGGSTAGADPQAGICQLSGSETVTIF